MVNAKGRTLSVAMIAIALMLAFGLFGFVRQAQAEGYAAGSVDGQGVVATQATSKSAASTKVLRNGSIKNGQKVTRTFTMPKKGYVTFNVKISKGVYDTFLRIDSGDIRYVETIVNSSTITGGDGTYTSSLYSFKPGAKIKVTLEMPTGIVSQKCAYRITMSKKSPKYYESEPNDKKSKANALKAGKTYSGNIYKKNVDWFVFKAPKAGTYKFSGKMALTTSGQLSIAEMSLYKGSKSAEVKYLRSGDGYENIASVKLKKGEKAYLKVSPNVSAAGLLATQDDAQTSSQPTDLTGVLPGNLASAIPADLAASLPSDTAGTIPSNLLSTLPSNVASSLPSNLISAMTGNTSITLPSNLAAAIPANASSNASTAVSGALYANTSASYSLKVSKTK